MNSEFAIATHCLLYLTYRRERLVPSDEIAKSTCVHPVRIRKMLSLLRKQNYIGSKEGAKGGFYLVKDPSQISLDEVYRLTSEGTLQPKCPQSNDRCLISAHIETVLQGIFHQAEEQVERFLRQYTVEEVFRLIKQSQLS